VFFMAGHTFLATVPLFPSCPYTNAFEIEGKHCIRSLHSRPDRWALVLQKYL
jgi:hypothetical protein